MVLCFHPKYGPCNKGRMSYRLIVALAVSIGIHLAMLFGADIELPSEAKVSPIMAELRPQPKPPPLFTPVANPTPILEKKVKKPRRKSKLPAYTTPVLSVPESTPVATVPSVDMQASASSGEALPEQLVEPVPDIPTDTLPVSVESRLPPRGIIRYRVDSGDRNFQIGVARQEWEIVDGHYKLSSVLETVGVAWLFKAYRLEMESRGLVTVDGLRQRTLRSGVTVRMPTRTRLSIGKI